MDHWARIYLFEVEFVDGTKVSQADDDRTQTALAADYGQAKCIRLVPQRPTFKLVEIDIPKDARAVYFRRNNVALANPRQLLRLQFCIGWAADGVMICNAADSKTGDVRLLRPERYHG